MLPVLMFIHSSALNASMYNDDVLEIFSKIMPRFILMSSQKQNLKNQIEICVLYDKMDESPASSLIEKIGNNYPKGIKNYPLKPINTSYSNIDLCRNSQLAFMFDSSDKNINQAIKYSKEHHILTMSYDANYLEKGVNGSLFLGRKVIPYVNMDSLRENGIELDNMLIQISKIYHIEDGR